jgi:hypothetical protein
VPAVSHPLFAGTFPAMSRALDAGATDAAIAALPDGQRQSHRAILHAIATASGTRPRW